MKDKTFATMELIWWLAMYGVLLASTLYLLLPIFMLPWFFWPH